jgi:hypothetical protein
MAASRHAQFRIQMKTFEQLARLREIPRTTAWYLTDLSEARGKQELYTKQSPQRLKVFARACADRETVSSNIEGGEKNCAHRSGHRSSNGEFSVSDIQRTCPGSALTDPQGVEAIKRR